MWGCSNGLWCIEIIIKRFRDCCSYSNEQINRRDKVYLKTVKILSALELWPMHTMQIRNILAVRYSKKNVNRQGRLRLNWHAMVNNKANLRPHNLRLRRRSRMASAGTNKALPTLDIITNRLLPRQAPKAGRRSQVKPASWRPLMNIHNRSELLFDNICVK